MTPNERKAELMRKGVSQQVIARRLKVSGATVSLVLSGRRQSAKVQAEVARRIGRDVAEVFPTRAA